MLYAAIIMSVILVASEVNTKFAKKDELKKAEEDGYEVIFTY